MQFDSGVDLTQRASPAQLPEWMDEPCTYEEFRDCLIDLGQVNWLTRSYRPTLDFLERLIDRFPTDRALRIVDVGFGGGDMLRSIERWAGKRRIAVELAGVDLNPYAARAAREFTRAASNIEWTTGDAFAWKKPVDVVLSSLFTHHLEEEEVVRFLAWSESIAKRGWFVNDLCREETPRKLFGLLAKGMRWHKFVQHDGPVSFRRSFREADWKRIAGEAGIAVANIQLTRWRPGRLCVERMK
ncbi:MAG: methyltransferase domain-containing protein [Acidobacteriaceae bacterium]